MCHGTTEQVLRCCTDFKAKRYLVCLYATMQFHLRLNTIQPPLLKDLQLNKNIQPGFWP